MEKLRALVVEDDERVMPSIEDALFSLGHTHDWVTNQADAQTRLEGRVYQYVLLDLQIPARAGRGGASTEFGLNLLRGIRETQGPSAPPVIIMTAHGNACVDLTRSLMENGAREFIAKPFPERGRTLASVVRGVLGEGAPAADGAWLTVTEAAELLMTDLPGLELEHAKARVSKAASVRKFTTNSRKGVARRIDRASFSAWRLEQRDRDLDAADE